MSIPGFTAESALLMPSAAYRVKTIPGDNSARVFLALIRNSDSESFQCCCGERCTSHLPCPIGCQQTCFCGNGYVLAICRCGTKTSGIGQVNGMVGQF
jgi:hypothetical protein